jgi:hypothetical protein
VTYNTIEDLPKAQTDQYNNHQKEAFLKASTTRTRNTVVTSIVRLPPRKQQRNVLGNVQAQAERYRRKSRASLR